MVYFVASDSTIHRARDLEGKTVALGNNGACADLVTRHYLREQGIDPSKLTWTLIPDDQSARAVASHQIDVAITHPPYSGAASRDPRLRQLWTDWDLDGGRSAMEPYIVNGTFLHNHPEAVRDFVGAIAKAAAWTHAHPDAARSWAAERLGVDVQTVGRDAYPPDLQVEAAPLAYYVEVLEQEGRILKGSVRVSDLYTNAYNPLLNPVMSQMAPGQYRAVPHA